MVDSVDTVVDLLYTAQKANYWDREDYREEEALVDTLLFP